jgi:hypothetical protein
MTQLTKIEKFIKEQIERLPKSLQEPTVVVDVPNNLYHENPDEFFKLMNERDDLIAKKLNAQFGVLKNYYGFDASQPNPYAVLTWKIVCDFIPAFTVKGIVDFNSTKLWEADANFLLWADVEKKIYLNKISGRQACLDLSKQRPWKKILAKFAKKNRDNKVDRSQKIDPAHLALYKKYIASKKSGYVAVFLGQKDLLFAELYEKHSAEFQRVLVRAAQRFFDKTGYRHPILTK